MDWAALAKQWIQMKETDPKPDVAEVSNDSSGSGPIMTSSSSIQPPPPPPSSNLREDLNLIDMEIEDEKDSNANGSQSGVPPIQVQNPVEIEGKSVFVFRC